MDVAIPPAQWFAVAAEIVGEACKRTSLHDYKSYARLKPVGIGDDYNYRISVLRELLTEGVLKLVDDERLMIADLSALPWFDEALDRGWRGAWNLQEIHEQHIGGPRKFSSERLAEIGLIGEEYVVGQLREALPEELHAHVKHVSLSDDTAGFDIQSPSTKSELALRFVEVKTSSRPNAAAFTLYLSRNEFEKGCKDPRWCVVAVQIIDGECQTVGHIFAHQIESRMPRDVTSNVSWETARLDVEHSLWQAGLP